MKKTPWLDAEKYRWKDAPAGYCSNYGDPYGIFLVPHPAGDLKVIVSAACDEAPWDHVSVSKKNRCPNWLEMCKIKDLFFDPDEAAMQIHPPANDYIDCHPYCLHIWKPMNQEIPLPPSIMVAPKSYLKAP